MDCGPGIPCHNAACCLHSSGEPGYLVNHGRASVSDNKAVVQGRTCRFQSKIVLLTAIVRLTGNDWDTQDESFHRSFPFIENRFLFYPHIIYLHHSFPPSTPSSSSLSLLPSGSAPFLSPISKQTGF